jgi:hypothetical protein
MSDSDDGEYKLESDVDTTIAAMDTRDDGELPLIFGFRFQKFFRDLGNHLECRKMIRNEKPLQLGVTATYNYSMNRI